MSALTLFPPVDRGQKAEAMFRIVGARSTGGNNVKALKGHFQGSCRYRLGNLRVVYTINDRELTVLVVTIAKRSDVYE